MTSETGRAGWRMTFHSGRATFDTATFHASDVRDAAGPFGCADGATRDSGSHFQANSTLMRTSTAAATPGPRGPHSLCVNDPRTAPILTPRLVAADNHPKARARCVGAIVSATQACATPVVPPPNPCTNP